MIHKELTPCMDCGGAESELNHFKSHKYKEWEVIYNQRLVLRDFCEVDFGSYKSTFFGFKNTTNIGFENFNFVKDIKDKRLQIGLFCNNCRKPHDFLKFVSICRENNSKK